ncbi:MAG: D-aminoacylase [Balneolales bacterium]
MTTSHVSPFSRRQFIKMVSAGGLVFSSSCASDNRYDVLILGGEIIDGTGEAPFRADVGIQNGRITSIGDLGGQAGRRIIDADGLVVSPGFIDIHNHSDYNLLSEPLCESMVRQGVTTMVLGEGNSAGPVRPNEQEWTTLGGYFDVVARQGVAVNICSYVGQGQVWSYVKGDNHTPATESEISEMSRLVEEAMQEGAMGLSTSLLMPPHNLITTGQLVELAEAAHTHGGIYSTHIRDEGRGVFDSVSEAIEIGRRTGCRVDIIHLKIAHKELWGRMDEVLAMISDARDEGLDIRANVYPYTAGQNNLVAIIPPWAHEGGREQLLSRLGDPAQRRRMRRDILEGIPGWYNHYLATGDGWDGMILVSLSSSENKPFEGRRMGELLNHRGGDPVETFFDILLEENGDIPAVFFHHSEEDMQLALAQPYTSVGSDGAAVSIGGSAGPAHPHPRFYGTFPRVLGRYVRELELLTLPEAVRKMTGMNADKINLKERGYIRKGYHADVAVFDPGRIIDRATFQEPNQYAEGIVNVIVNGEIILDDDSRTEVLPGKVIRSAGSDLLNGK